MADAEMSGYEYIGQEPEFVTFSAFGHLFENYPSGLAENLITLEREGAIYSHFLVPGSEKEDGSADFAYYRIPFLPNEIYQYVEASLAYDQYQKAREAGASFDEALGRINDLDIVERVRRYGDFGHTEMKNGATLDIRGCHASFYPEGMEGLVCGARRDRYEELPERGATRDRFALLMQVINNFPVVARLVRLRQHDRPPFVIDNEYDVQDLLFALIRTVFEDAHREEWTPKLAGSAKRTDILVPSIGAMVEVKFVRDAKHAKTVADELKVDFESYHAHALCKHVIALVYDPAQHLSDAVQFGSELSGLRRKGEHSFDVTVLVR